MADQKLGEGALTRMLKLGLSELQAASVSFFDQSNILQRDPAAFAAGPPPEAQPEAAPEPPPAAEQEQNHSRGR